MVEIKNILIASLACAGLFLFVAFFTFPTPSSNDEKWQRSLALWKGTAISFCFVYLALFFMESSLKKEVMSNVIKTKPDF